MELLLYNPLNKNLAELAVYDDATGEVVGSRPRGDVRHGNCYAVDGKWVALYVYDGELYVQIGPNKFNLGSPATKLEYWHNWHTGMTTFRASDPTATAELVYRSWWSQLGHEPSEVQFEPERDEDEDELAYLVGVWRKPERQRSLIEQWG